MNLEFRGGRGGSALIINGLQLELNSSMLYGVVVYPGGFQSCFRFRRAQYCGVMEVIFLAFSH